MSDVFMLRHHAAITSAAARNNVPAVYPNSSQARDGGLLSYGPPGDGTDIRRRAASYVDRILRGEKPGDLPVQFPTTFWRPSANEWPGYSSLVESCSSQIISFLRWIQAAGGATRSVADKV